MNRKGIALLFSVLYFTYWAPLAQKVTIDTLKPNHGVLGSSDTLLRFFQSSNGIFPGLDGYFPSLVNPFLRYMPMGSFIHPTIGRPNTPRYTSLPYVGFAYVFGSHGSQHIQLSYDQTFRGGWIFNASMQSHAGGGMIRNNFWRYRNVHSGLYHQGKRNAFALSIQTVSDRRPFSLGLQQPVLANDFTIDLLPVRKDSCRSDGMLKTLTLSNAFRFSKDSLHPFRLNQVSALSSRTRNYVELDTLAGWYPLIQFDSLHTADRYEYVVMQHHLGISYDKGPLTVFSGPTYRYWRARFNGLQSDSSEVGVNFGFVWHQNRWNVKGFYEKNLFGAFGEQRANLEVHQLLDSLKHWGGAFSFGQVAPDVFQRWYSGNTVSYQLNNPKTQTYFALNVSLTGLRDTWRYRVYLQGLQTQGVYQFDGSTWNNQVSGSQCTLAGLGGELDFMVKGFRVRPGVLCMLDRENRFPLTKIDLLLNKTFIVKKPKNLQLFSTLAMSYMSGFSPLGIHPVVSAFDFSMVGSNRTKGYLSVVTLFGFKVQTFRFFLTGTNLGYFFQPNANELFQNYPLPPWQLKVGITWDFWN